MSEGIIYEKTFPREAIPENNAEDTKANNDTERISFEEIMERIYKNVVYVLMPGREEKAKHFIRKAIEVSELYELDIKIVKHFSHISADYYFNSGGQMKYLLEVIREADDISFFANIKGYEIVMCLDFYTHATYRNGRMMRP